MTRQTNTPAPANRTQLWTGHLGTTAPKDRATSTCFGWASPGLIQPAPQTAPQTAPDANATPSVEVNHEPSVVLGEAMPNMDHQEPTGLSPEAAAGAPATAAPLASVEPPIDVAPSSAATVNGQAASPDVGEDLGEHELIDAVTFRGGLSTRALVVLASGLTLVFAGVVIGGWLLLSAGAAQPVPSAAEPTGERTSLVPSATPLVSVPATEKPAADTAEAQEPGQLKQRLASLESKLSELTAEREAAVRARKLRAIARARARRQSRARRTAGSQPLRVRYDERSNTVEVWVSPTPTQPKVALHLQDKAGASSTVPVDTSRKQAGVVDPLVKPASTTQPGHTAR